MRFYVLSSYGCMNAIRCWIGDSLWSHRMSALAFNLNVFRRIAG